MNRKSEFVFFLNPYKYDQLQRLTKSTSFEIATITTQNKWLNPSLDNITLIRGF